MSKFCGYCGSMMDDSARNCGQCGKPIDSKDYSRIHEYGQENLKTKFQNKKKLVIPIALLVLIIVVFSISSSFFGKKGVVNQTVNAIEKFDIEKLQKLSSDFYTYADTETFKDEIQYTTERILKHFDNEVGYNIKIKHEILDIYELPQRKYDELSDGILYMYPAYDISKIKKMAMADVRLSATQDRRTATKDIEILISKEGMNWKLLAIDTK